MDEDPIHEAMLAYWGERCSAYHEECVCCQAWEQYDGKKAAMLDAYGMVHKAQKPNFGPQPGMQYGMNQDDWKDIVAAISKARDSRGIYLACRPADVFQDWFLALGTFKPKEKNT
jgi:hypothetical protein